MDNRYYDNVIAGMQEFLNQHSFKCDENGIFYNDSKKAEIKYNEERQMYVLSVADIVDGETGEFRELSSWLFDDSQTAKDAEAVSIDFVSSLKKELGIKTVRSNGTNGVALPTGSKTGKMDIQGFTKKMLDVYPTLKNEYKKRKTITPVFKIMSIESPLHSNGLYQETIEFSMVLCYDTRINR